MSSLISEDLRRQVASRADFICEYCLIHQDDSLLTFQIDHIISRKHGGHTELENLALACAVCNRQKGSDVGSIIPSTRTFIRFYNPRSDAWMKHFRVAGAVIEALDPIGEATARIFGFNHADRILERELLIQIGRYPSIPALARLRG